MKYNISDFDFIFLSYDEPNSEILYAELENLIPWAKRVHGIKGFDAAHRACADISETEFFVTIDGDNVVYPEFLDQEIEISDTQHDHAWTWSSRNKVNGLVYGNGGLKLWSKEFVYNMNSHENASTSSSAVDFCWDTKYHDVYGCYSESVINSTPEQAWRSGFREGVKMCLDRGNRISINEFYSKLWYGNINRLCIWASVGNDVENGIWSIYGARMGAYLSLLTTDDYTIISDYDKMKDLWTSISKNDPEAESIKIGTELNAKVNLELSLLSPEFSKFFKKMYMNLPRPWLSYDQIKHLMAIKHV